MDRQWKESKVQGYTTFSAPKIGPAPIKGALRYAFIQPLGPGSVPRDATMSDVDGGRITRYAVSRPFAEMISYDGLESALAGAAGSLVSSSIYGK